MCFRAEDKTVDTLDRIAADLDVSRADLLLSMTKFALTNHDWSRFGLTHKPLPFGYGVASEVPTTNPAPIWKRKRPESLGEPVPLTPKQKAAAKAMAKAAGRKYPNLVDNIAASRMENPTMKTATKRKPTPAQLAARERFAEMARSGAFKKAGGRKANPAKKTHVWRITVFDDDGRPAKVTTDSEEQGALLYAKSKADANMAGEIHYILPKSERLEFWFDGSGIHRAGTYGDQPIYTTRRAALRSNPAKPAASRRGNPADEYTYSVDMEGMGKSGLFMTKAVFKTAQDAKQYARALAKSYPSRTIRVMSGGRWIKR
jgi:hypothetical protein